MIEISVDDSYERLIKQIGEVPKRAEAARNEFGLIITKRLVDKVKEKIPRGGWYDIYRNAITFYEVESGVYGVRAMVEVDAEDLDAEATLLWFKQGNEAAQAVSVFNPWTLDALPAVKGGYFADIIVRPASESEVANERSRLAGEMNAVRAALTRLGLAPQEQALPRINGKVYADIDFLSRRLEHGLGGFPRIAHWGPAVGEVDRIANSKEVREAFQKALETGVQSIKSKTDAPDDAQA